MPTCSEGILGGDYQKRLGERVGFAVSSHPLLFHRLQQGALGLRHGPVYFVNQEDIVEDRPLDETEAVLMAIKDCQAGDVGREQIAGALYPSEGETERAGKGYCQGGFAEAGNVLDQNMAAGQKGDDGKFQRLFPAGQVTGSQFGNDSVQVCCSWLCSIA